MLASLSYMYGEAAAMVKITRDGDRFAVAAALFSQLPKSFRRSAEWLHSRRFAAHLELPGS